MLQSLADVRTIELPRHVHDNGELVVAEALSDVPFAIARVFTLRAPLDAVRGEHAHRLCSQMMLCVHGKIDIVCDDGHATRTFTLDRNNGALLVPPTIWNTVIFRSAHAILLVMCDRPYEEADYIRDRIEFMTFRKAIVP